MYHINIQHIADKALAPKASLLRKWAIAALQQKVTTAEINVRLVGLEEMTTLNATYRHKNKPTNVLSFPFTAPVEAESEMPYLGDIVICSEVVNDEAREQGKLNVAHWAHMIIHGTFHLLGYDHQTDEEARTMETLEIATLQNLGFENPYLIGEDKPYHD